MPSLFYSRHTYHKCKLQPAAQRPFHWINHIERSDVRYFAIWLYFLFGVYLVVIIDNLEFHFISRCDIWFKKDWNSENEVV